jgi:hypothetical protein
MLEDIGPITQNSLKIALECYYSLSNSHKSHFLVYANIVH